MALRRWMVIVVQCASKWKNSCVIALNVAIILNLPSDGQIIWRWTNLLQIRSCWFARFALNRGPICGQVRCAKTFASIGRFLMRQVFWHYHIYCLLQVGVAFFRKDFPPDLDNPLCHNGGVVGVNFVLPNHANAGLLLARFDQLLLAFTHFAIIGLPSNLAHNIGGIFIRLDVDKNAPDGFRAYENPFNLPCSLKLEVWIRDRRNEVIKNEIKWRTKQWLLAKMDALGIPREHFLLIRFYKWHIFTHFYY